MWSQFVTLCSKVQHFEEMFVKLSLICQLQVTFLKIWIFLQNPAFDDLKRYNLEIKNYIYLQFHLTITEMSLVYTWLNILTEKFALKAGKCEIFRLTTISWQCHSIKDFLMKNINELKTKRLYCPWIGSKGLFVLRRVERNLMQAVKAIFRRRMWENEDDSKRAFIGLKRRHSETFPRVILLCKFYLQIIFTNAAM